MIGRQEPNGRATVPQRRDWDTAHSQWLQTNEGEHCTSPKIGRHPIIGLQRFNRKTQKMHKRNGGAARTEWWGDSDTTEKTRITLMQAAEE